MKKNYAILICNLLLWANSVEAALIGHTIHLTGSLGPQTIDETAVVGTGAEFSITLFGTDILLIDISDPGIEFALTYVADNHLDGLVLTFTDITTTTNRHNFTGYYEDEALRDGITNTNGLSIVGTAAGVLDLAFNENLQFTKSGGRFTIVPEVGTWVYILLFITTHHILRRHRRKR